MSDFAELAYRVIVEPDFASAAVLFWSSLLNEIISIFPYIVVISTQFPFVQDPFSIATLTKISLFVFVPVSIGAGIGSIPLYAIAYWGGKPAIEKFGKYIRLSWTKVERVHSRFNGSWYDELTFLILRSLPLTPTIPVSIAAGIVRMNFASYLVLTIAGTVIRIAIMFTFVAFGAEGIETLAK